MSPTLSPDLTDEAARAALQAHVLANGYPCIMATSVLRRDQITVGTYSALGTAEASDALAADLAAFVREPEPERGFRSFAAVFGGDAPASEETFEHGLWATLQALHDRDDAPWDSEVSADPASPEFSFSFAGRAFYVVGMHPQASRPARTFRRPLVLFNLHSQFEQLRAEGRYDRVRDVIRGRDRAFAGSINPMMDDFGARSEARQYSGRAVGADWRCPFHAD